MIEIRELYKYYGVRRALGPLSASIEQGEIVGLLGLNGAGKTTTLRILACDLLPTSGSVKVDGIDVVERPEEVRRRIGYLPDTPPLYDEMTVREFLRFAARLRRVDSADLDKRVGEVIEQTEVKKVQDDPISSLSHGYRQRVGIAQAIVHRPALVVLDEPISGLDPVQIVEMRSLVRSLGGDHTVIVSSHILSEISETCDRIIVIDEGRMIESGSEAEIAARGGRGEGGMVLEVALRNPGLDIGALLAAIDGVEEAELLERGEGIESFRVQTSRDVRGAVSRALLQDERVELLELSRTERELENVFLRLTETRNAGKAKRAADELEARA